MFSPTEILVFKALGDFSIVDRLSHNPATTGELVAEYAPQLVRTAVMKHLDVLEKAQLVHVERIGRTRRSHLHTQPLRMGPPSGLMLDCGRMAEICRI